MTTIRAFHKILSHQERLKNQAQANYQEAVNSFEQVATKLYALLQKKERVETEYNYYLEASGTVTTLATHYAYIEQIKKQIEAVQVEVNRERFNMEKKQEKLTEAHVEVKKFEKIIEKKKSNIIALEVYQESQAMDEVSNRQYFSRDR